MRVNPGVSQSIQGSQTEGLKKTEQTAKTDRARTSEGVSKNTESSSPARSEISEKAKNFAKAHAAASATPDVRDERIAELKKRIAGGEYKIDSDAIAEKMMSEHAL